MAHHFTRITSAGKFTGDPSVSKPVCILSGLRSETLLTLKGMLVILRCPGIVT